MPISGKSPCFSKVVYGIANLRLVFVGIASGDVESLIWGDGVAGSSPVIAHINMFQLSRTGARVIAIRAIGPHQPIGSDINRGEGSLSCTNYSMRFQDVL